MSRHGDTANENGVVGGVYKPKSDLDQQNYTNPALGPPASPPPVYSETVVPVKKGENGVVDMGEKGEKGPRPGSSEEKDKKDEEEKEKEAIPSDRSHIISYIRIFFSHIL